MPYSKKYAHLCLLLILFLLAEILVMPVGEFPLNDDCIYTKAALVLAVDGTVNIGEWPAMTLLTNLLWGAMFIKIFGFSFFILRISTLIVSLIGVALMYAMVRERSNNPRHAFAAGLVLAFNPWYFNLSNTFMTDVNFTVLLIAGVYVIGKYMSTGNYWWLAVFMALSLLLVLLRQYGLMLPVTFMLVSLAYRNRRWVNFACAAGIVLVCSAVLWRYEQHLSSVLSRQASYKFIFGGGDEIDYLKIVKESFTFKISTSITQMSMYLLPVSLMVLSPAYQRIGWVKMTLCFAASFFIYRYFVYEGHPILPNIVSNINIGPDTFYESLSAYYTHIPDHTSIPQFTKVVYMYKAVSCILSCSALLSGILVLITYKPLTQVSPLTVVILLLSGFYMVSLLTTPSYFDRYHLPLIGMALLLTSGLYLDTRSWLAYLVIIGFAWISVAGTRDYFTMNRLRWQAYNHLTQEKGIPPADVHAGFETGCWSATKYSYLYGADVLQKQKYLIQYTPEPKFKRIRSYPFKRYLLPGRDTIHIFARE